MMLRQSKRTRTPPSTPPGPTAAVADDHDDDRPRCITPPRRRKGFWNKPMNVVAMFTGSCAFAAALTIGMINATRVDSDTVLFRLLLGQTDSTKNSDNSFLSKISNKETMPILLMGLPRSGSEAIHNFFTCNNIRSSHYCCDATTTKNNNPRVKFPCGKEQFTCGSCVLKNMQTERPPLEGCGDYQVWSQFDVETSDPFSWFLPQHYTLPLLHEAYPKAPIILNRRLKAEDWAESVLHWHSITTRLFESFHLEMILQEDLPPVPEEITYESLVQDMQISLNRVMSHKEWNRKRDLLVNIYEQHNDKVRRFARDYHHAFIEVIVDDPHLGLKLQKEFQLISADCWKFNATEYQDDWKNFSLPF